MQWVAGLAGTAIVLVVLWDAFETIVVPKTVERRLRISTAYYRVIWRIWHLLARSVRRSRHRQTALQSFGPLSLLFLFVVWATTLVGAFGLIHWGIGALGPERTLGDALYYSGVTFFTLGYGDMTSRSPLGHFVAVAEAGTGFGFLAIIIGYVPVLYQAFSYREHFILRMDSRAGSDPSGGELIRRHAEANALPLLRETLREAEEWAAHSLETMLSYPILAYYRSQHDTQSWLTTITSILDCCSLVIAGFDGDEDDDRQLRFQAKATFAMARHVIVDVAYVLDDPPVHRPLSRIGPATAARLEQIVAQAAGSAPPDFSARLTDLRAQYEPYLVGLARDLHFTLPAWVAEDGHADNWQRSAWDELGHF